VIVKDDLRQSVIDELVAINKAVSITQQGAGSADRNYLLALGLVDAYKVDGQLTFAVSKEGKELIEREQLS
jgi:hypothetical protein